MSRFALPTALAALAVALPAQAGTISLRIAFKAHETAPLQLTTLRCGARSTGTVPRPAEACRRLRALGAGAFRPTAPDRACTEIFGGPSTARVTGFYFDRTLWVRLSRVNGCEIARWDRVGFLLPRSAAPR